MGHRESATSGKQAALAGGRGISALASARAMGISATHFSNMDAPLEQLRAKAIAAERRTQAAAE